MKKQIALLATAMLVLLIFSPMSAFAASPSFTDISEHWAESVIKNFADESIVLGFPDGTFRPDQPVTRAELARIITLAFRLTADAPFNFDDVSADAWYYEYLQFAASFIPNHQHGGTSFAGNANAFRIDVAETLARLVMRDTEVDVPALEEITFDVRNTFRDSDYMFGDIRYPNVQRLFRYTWLANRLQIIQRDPSGYFLPAWGITRAELLVMIDRIRHH